MNSLQSFIPPSAASQYSESADSIINALKGYSEDIHRTDLRRISSSLASLSDDDREWLQQVHRKLGIAETLQESVTSAVEHNQKYLDQLVKYALLFGTENTSKSYSPDSIAARVRILPWAVSREWGTDDGLVKERDEVMLPILSAVRDHIACNDAKSKKILVPGSGCGRLLYELACEGFQTVGIEFDGFRLASCAHIFDLRGDKTTIRPFVLETCNRMHTGDNTRDVLVPDIDLDRSALSRITLNGNEFFEAVAGIDNAEFDGIVTSFFLDTITDVERYVEEFSRLLKPGGYWINCGPLHFHYGGERRAPQAPKKECCVESLIASISQEGFEVLEQRIINTTYLGNRASMMKTELGCVFGIARKL